jgi:hypothetical protein
MMDGGMMLGEVVSKVFASGFPEDVELALEDAVADPVVSHVHVAGFVLLDGIVGETGCGGVIGLNRCSWLRIPHVLEGLAQDQSFLLRLTKRPPTSASAAELAT